MKKFVAISFLLSVFFLTACSNATDQIEFQASSAQEQLDVETVVQAVNTMNLELCSTVENSNQKTDCEIKVKDAIIFKNAENKADKSLCNDIVQSNAKSKCEIVVDELLEKNNEAKKITEEQEESAKIEQSGKVEDCKTISDEGIRKQCETNIYLKKARDANDKKYCDKMSSDELKNLCLSQLS